MRSKLAKHIYDHSPSGNGYIGEAVYIHLDHPDAIMRYALGNRLNCMKLSYLKAYYPELVRWFKCDLKNL